MALIEIYLIKFVLNGIIDFSYFLKLLKTTEKSVMDVLTKKSQKLYSKSYSMSSLYNLQNSDSMPVSENTSLSSIFSNITSFTNLADYENDEENANVSLNSKDESYYEYLFFKNCEIFYAEVVLIRGFIETVIGKEIRGVIRIRKAWKLYNIFQNENYMNRIGTTEKEQSILSSIKYSVVFGIGFTHIFSFLLNKNELQTINLTPNMDKGINCLGEIIQLNEHKAPISVLLIFVIYVYFNKCKRALKVCQSIREHFPNSIIFTYLFNTTLSIQHTNTKPLFTCDPEKYIRFLGPYFNKKVVNSFLNQKWEDTINNLEEYNKLVKSKNLKLAKNNNYYEHIYIVDKYIRIDNQSLINENKLCIYCLLQPFVIPITNMEQYIYKWCCLKMVLFDYKKDLKIMKDKYKKRNEKELSMPISMNDGTNNEEGIENQNSFNGDINENKNKSENSINNDIKNTSSTNSIDIDKIIESDPVYLAKKEKYEKLKKEFKQFNETFINQCKEYKKSKEISHEKSHLMPDDLPFVMCCQLDPIILYIASNIDNNIDNTSSSSDIFSLIDIVCILFAIHYASPSKMTDLLVKLFPTLNSDSYNTLMNPPLHINTQYIVKCLNSFNK
ncbi:hypothetical protein BCR36DRAFT_104771 [Piromyces finnis]|uniref:Uncharacterized protein n=1 Tax=Piromyces finnis TaxID=1754191 RepID=A0A1Y1V4F1_9FUNG|nr:hypothetical protein BCR36DRAFT_104771 [Piromyces finnis]|eukprot:ORX46177.1 hypothetical protein BCR36DRAFT_104771 [Piromyces finnis]